MWIALICAFGGRLPALEAVDADHGAGAGHVLELPLHLVRIVRQRVHLLARQRRAERAAAPIGGAFLLVLSNRDRLLDLLNRQHDDVPVVARAHAHVFQDARIEPGELGLHAVPAWREARNRRNAVRRRLRRRRDDVSRRVFQSGHRHGGVRHDGVALIDDGDEEPGRACGLRERRSRGRKEQQQRQSSNRKPRHLRTSNFFGSIFALIRKRSNVVSSIVVRADRAADAEREPQPVNLAIVGIVDAILRGSRLRRSLRRRS